MSLTLRRRIGPYFLRRTKEEVLSQKVAEGSASGKAYVAPWFLLLTTFLMLFLTKRLNAKFLFKIP